MAELDPDAPVLARAVGAVKVVTLNRPATLNAIDQDMAAALQAALQAVAADGGCRCLVLVGAGRGFCSGQALPTTPEESLPADLAQLIRDRYVPIVTGLRALPLPVLAAVNGPAVGAGFSLALAADLRVASSSAWFSCGFAKLGLVPDAGATYFLPRILGPARSLSLVLSGERIGAETALQQGLVSQVYPAATFEADYLRLATELASGPTLAYARTKEALNASWEASLDQQMEREAQLQQASSQTGDFREGLVAFYERRPPQFRGR